jgi:DNA-directed RNA polymerase specialized sigma subunit
MLTEIESLLVEKNHNLIYWVASKMNLDLEEWYDLLAIELCLTVQRFDSEKSTLANFYLIRVGNLVKKEYKKLNTNKRYNEGHVSLDEVVDFIVDKCPSNETSLDWIMELDPNGILKLKAEGFTQKEIADSLGVSQPYVSNLIAKVRREYELRMEYDR